MYSLAGSPRAPDGLGVSTKRLVSQAGLAFTMWYLHSLQGSKDYLELLVFLPPPGTCLVYVRLHIF